MRPQEAIRLLLNDTDRVFSTPALVAEMCRSLLRIRSKEGKIVPLDPNATQMLIITAFCEQWQAGGVIRIVCLKGRQQGSSTIACALTYLMLLAQKNMHGLLASEKKLGSAVNLWNVYTLFTAQFPLIHSAIAFEKRFERKGYEKNIRFRLKNGSELRVEGQGKALSYATDIIHISEAGFFQDLTEWLSHALPSIEDRYGTMIIVESTALRYGDGFHDIWDRAQNEISGYKAVFAAWFVHERNVATPKPDLEMTLGQLEKYGDELLLQRDFDLSLEQLQFRRNRIDVNGSIAQFQREYPSTPDEAFLAAERPVLHQPSLQYMLTQCVVPDFKGVMKPEKRDSWDGTEKARFTEDYQGFIDIYEKPIAFTEYIAASDHAKGVPSGDWNTGLIAKRSPFEVVAKIRGTDSTKLEAREFARQFYYLMRWYNDPYVLPENNESGQTVIGILDDWNYPNIALHRDVFPDVKHDEKGWNNNRTTRKQAIDLLIEAMWVEIDEEGKVRFPSDFTPVIPDEQTIIECIHLVYEDGKAQAKRKGQYRAKGESEVGFFDDLVFALMGLLLLQSSLPAPLIKEALMLKELGANHRLTEDMPLAFKEKYARDFEQYASPNAWYNHL